jgi:hypothetical protein
VVVLRCRRDVLTSLLHPVVRVRIAHEIEEPAQEGKTVTAAKSESYRVRGKGVGEGAWIVVSTSNGVCDELGDSLQFFVIVQQIRGYARWACHRHASDHSVLVRLETPDMKTNIRASRLAPRRQRELMLIGREMAETI